MNNTRNLHAYITTSQIQPNNIFAIAHNNHVYMKNTSFLQIAMKTYNNCTNKKNSKYVPTNLLKIYTHYIIMLSYYWQ